MKTWTFVDYFDVWRDEEEGYFVNNLSREEDDITFASDYPTDEELLDWLKNEKGILKPSTSLSDLAIEDYGDGFIEIFDAETYEPLCRFEMNRDFKESKNPRRKTENYYKVRMRGEDAMGRQIVYDRYVSAYDKREVRDAIEDQKLFDEKNDWIDDVSEIDIDEYLRNRDKQYTYSMYKGE